jgi:hypothetical protein
MPMDSTKYVGGKKNKVDGRAEIAWRLAVAETTNQREGTVHTLAGTSSLDDHLLLRQQQKQNSLPRNGIAV